MPMIKNRASHSDVDLGELETCLTESTTNVYVYEDYGDLSKYEQAWKIDKLVWDKFFGPEEFPMLAPRKPAIVRPESLAVKEPKPEDSRRYTVKPPEQEDTRRWNEDRSSSTRGPRPQSRSRVYDDYSSRDMRPGYQELKKIVEHHGWVDGDFWRPVYNDKPRIRKRSRSRSPRQNDRYESRPRRNSSRPDLRRGIVPTGRSKDPQREHLDENRVRVDVPVRRGNEEVKLASYGTSTGGQQRNSGDAQRQTTHEVPSGQLPYGDVPISGSVSVKSPMVGHHSLEDGEI